MTHRVHNFGAGPGALPLPVLETVRDELLDHRGSGMSILETSHRSPRYDEVHQGAIAGLRELLGGAALGDGYEVLFMGGGARTQFGLVPWNLMPPGGSADYLVTGRWAEMAAAEGAKRGRAREAWSSAGTGHDRVPGPGDYEVDPAAAYLHYTSNNTIFGTQLREPPEAGDVPLVADMSSDVLSRPLDLGRFGLIYAGAQKNLGPAGVTVVVVRRDLLPRSPAELPDTLSYAKMAAKSSLLNTPPVFAIYVLDLVLRHLREQGGLEAAARRNEEKAALLYRAIDGSGGFYRGHARPEARSLMNVTFRLPSEELEARFLAEAGQEGLAGLKGHRSVGGVRASLYNAVDLPSVEALVRFMEAFLRRAG
ncbi:MAG TPA: 3-phosphoserine/phosphohydroxythreonine transaminase [Thermoanaerobaculia bacterium]